MPSPNLGSRATIANSLVYGVDISSELANPHSLIGRLILDDVAIVSARLIEANREIMRDAFSRLSQEQQEIEALRKKSAQQQVASAVPYIYSDAKPQSSDQSSSSRILALVAELGVLNGKRLGTLNDAALGITLYRMAIRGLATTMREFVNTVATALVNQGVRLLPSSSLPPTTASHPSPSAPSAQDVQQKFVMQAVRDSLEDVWNEIYEHIGRLPEQELAKLGTVDGHQLFSIPQQEIIGLLRKSLSKRFDREGVNLVMGQIMPFLEDVSSNSVRWISIAMFNKQLIEIADRQLNQSDKQMKQITDNPEFQRGMNQGGITPQPHPAKRLSKRGRDDDENRIIRAPSQPKS